jgi:hypothetical protein
VCAAAGLLGLKFLLFTLHRMTTALDDSCTPDNEPKGALEKIEGRPFGANVTAIFRIWVIVFALVGAQMSWVLRPFIGAPHVAFAWLRERDSNFFEAVFHALGRLLGG